MLNCHVLKCGATGSFGVLLSTNGITTHDIRNTKVDSSSSNFVYLLKYLRLILY
jgi:hypothetical protein